MHQICKCPTNVFKKLVRWHHEDSTTSYVAFSVIASTHRVRWTSLLHFCSTCQCVNLPQYRIAHWHVFMNKTLYNYMHHCISGLALLHYCIIWGKCLIRKKAAMLYIALCHANMSWHWHMNHVVNTSGICNLNVFYTYWH